MAWEGIVPLQHLECAEEVYNEVFQSLTSTASQPQSHVSQII
jgi:hypothetical protein